MTEWLSLVPSVLFLDVLWMALGCAWLFAVGVRRARLYLSAPLVSFAWLGAVSVLSAWTGWTLATVFFTTLVCLTVTILGRSLVSKEAPSTLLGKQLGDLRADCSRVGVHTGAWLLVGFILVSGGVLALIAQSVSSPQMLLQQYDCPFHMSVIRHIVTSGNASPIGAGSVMGTENAIYPSLWHACAALVIQVFGLTIASSVWCTTLALVQFALPCSVGLLVCELMEHHRGPSLVCASLLASLSEYSVFRFVVFGPLFANLCGLVVLPAAIALLVEAFDKEQSCLGMAGRVLALVVGVIGLGFAQPNTVFSLTLFALPLLVATRRSKWARLGVVALFVACWWLCLSIPFFARTINCLDRVTDDIVLGKELAQSVGLDYETLSNMEMLPVCVFAIIVALGSLLAWRLRPMWRNSWYVVTLSIMFGQVVVTLVPFNWFTVVATGFWYRDYYRTLELFWLFSYVLLGMLMEAALMRVSAQHGAAGHAKGRQMLVGVVGAMCALACVLFVRRGFLTYCPEFTTLTEGATSGFMPDTVSPERASFCEEIADEVGEASVLNNFNDASVWLYPVFGVDAQLKGKAANQITPMEDDLYTLITQIDRIGDGSEEGTAALEAAHRLDIKYVTQMSDEPNFTTQFRDDGSVSAVYSNAICLVDETTPGASADNKVASCAR